MFAGREFDVGRGAEEKGFAAIAANPGSDIAEGDIRESEVGRGEGFGCDGIVLWPGFAGGDSLRADFDEVLNINTCSSVTSAFSSFLKFLLTPARVDK